LNKKKKLELCANVTSTSDLTIVQLHCTRFIVQLEHCIDLIHSSYWSYMEY